MQAWNMKYPRSRFTPLSGPAILTILAIFLFASMPSFGQARVIEVLADKDSHFKMAGMSHPEITVKAGEPLLLRINARKGKTMNRDGTVHGFTLLRAKDHHKVTGWDLELKPGTQEFSLTAPAEPGEYEVLCTVICSEEHEGMRMKFVVLP
jgi:heme/copper-type cytochrome/quinol oxidase subunit 2